MTNREEPATSPTLMRRLTPWAVFALLGTLLLGIIPSAFAAPGDSAGEALPVGANGTFSGTAAPEDSTWFRFTYVGDDQPVTVSVTYQPDDAEPDLFLFTGSADDPRRESASASRNNNTLSQSFSDPQERDVWFEIVNEDSSRTVSFVGSISPSSAQATPSADVSTPTPGPVAQDAQSALTVESDGGLAGTIGPRQAVWYRFWYGNPGANATVNATFAPSADNADLSLYTSNDPNNPTQNQQGGSPSRSGDRLSRTVNLPSAQWVYFTLANNNDGTTLAYAGSVNPAFAGPTPTTTATAVATATAIPQATSTPVPAATPQPAPVVPHDERYFQQTRYRIDSDVIWTYFNARGQVNTFGFPVSRTFTFKGCPVQMFQRLVVQICPGQGPALLNFLDPDIFPYTQFNGSTVPGPDEAMKLSTPRVTDPNYATAIIDFVRMNAPDFHDNQPVGFGQKFFTSVTPQMAGTDDQNILALLDLEVWGAPISRPQRDPNNSNFIYQRFQRGIMHYRAGIGTEGLLLPDYLKAILTGQNLPGDLRAQAQNSQYYLQYCPGQPGWLCRPDALPATDLTFAFAEG